MHSTSTSLTVHSLLLDYRISADEIITGGTTKKRIRLSRLVFEINIRSIEFEPEMAHGVLNPSLRRYKR